MHADDDRIQGGGGTGAAPHRWQFDHAAEALIGSCIRCFAAAAEGRAMLMGGIPAEPDEIPRALPLDPARLRANLDRGRGPIMTEAVVVDTHGARGRLLAHPEVHDAAWAARARVKSKEPAA